MEAFSHGSAWTDIAASENAGSRALAYLSNDAITALEYVAVPVLSFGPSGWPLHPVGADNVAAFEVDDPSRVPEMAIAHLLSDVRQELQ